MDGSSFTTPIDFFKLFLVTYELLVELCGMSIVTAPNISAYWSQSSLYCGLLDKHFMSRNRYKQINCLKNTYCMFEDTDNDKLAKGRYLYNVIKFKCRELYQPSNNISVDEKMVRIREGMHLGNISKINQQNGG